MLITKLKKTMKAKKNKLVKLFKLGIFLIGSSFILSNCENEQIETQNDTIQTLSKSEIDNFKNNQLSYKAKGLKTFSKFDFDEISYQKIKNSSESLAVIPVNLNYKDVTSRLLLIKINGSVESVFFHMSKNEKPNNEFFSGKIGITNLSGKLINAYLVKDGIIISKLVKKETQNKKYFAKSGGEDCDEDADNRDIFCNQELEEITIQSNSRNNAPFTGLYVSPSTGQEGGTNGPDTGMSWNYGTGGGGSNGPVDNNNSADDKIDSSELTDKAKCLNDKLTQNGNTFIKDILSKFEGNSKFDINIKSVDKIFRKNTTIELNGKTRHTPGSSLINIEISTNKLSDMPALAAARTLIHEYIHADMYRKINTTNYDGDLDFKTTYEYFKNGNFLVTPQHDTMADLYVNSMRDALKNFHKNVLEGDYNYLTNNGTNPLPNSFYEALAWQGLKDHNVKAYTDLASSKKTELTNALNAHYHSTTKNCPN